MVIIGVLDLVLLSFKYCYLFIYVIINVKCSMKIACKEIYIYLIDYKTFSTYLNKNLYFIIDIVISVYNIFFYYLKKNPIVKKIELLI